MTGPLEGIKVIDVSAVVSGPLAAMILGDQGADVLKVEPPKIGEVVRLPNFERGGLTSLFINCNRNKRGVTLDLSKPEGIDIMHRLIEETDVFIQNWRPGAAERMGLGAETLRRINPNLIYCSISGFGATGPYSDQRVYDPIIQGLTGHAGIQMSPDFPIPDLVRNIVADKSTSYTAAQAITAALFARDRGAGGQLIEVPMIDASLAFFWPDGMIKHTLEDSADLLGKSLYETYRLWHTQDGQIIYFVASQVEHEGLFRALDHPEWIDDPRFATTEARMDPENAEVLGGLLDEAIRSFTTKALLQKMNENEVPNGRVLSLEEVFDDPQIQHNGSILEFDHPSAGKYRQAKPAARFSGTPQDPQRRMPPLLGEHTEEVLAELGLSEEEITTLRNKAVF
jgi:crotonobetainyl-CoA:carnitine CoA-transferase CaiB-like acyl-CoA transferase